MRYLRGILALLCLVTLIHGAAALDGWSNHGDIQYSACDQDIYQQDIVVHRSAGTAYEEESGGLKIWHVYLGSDCKSDYGDIRFTGAAGTELAYYLWPDYTSETARFCVRLTGATSAGTVRVWYGNPSVISTSSSPAIIYEFAQGFDEAPWDLATWTSINEGSASVVDNTLKISSSSSPLGGVQRSLNRVNIIIETSLKSDTQIGANAVDNMANRDGTYTFKSSTFKSSSGIWALDDTSKSKYDVAVADLTQFTPIIITLKSTSTYDVTSQSNTVYNIPIRGDVGATYDYLDLSLYNSDTTGYVDYVLVRAYSAAPPSATAFILSSAPTPDFTVDAQYGTPDTTFQFTDQTSANPAATYLWNFGDGQTSTEQNPAHKYASTGDYTVSLEATNIEGTVTETKTAYIHVGNFPSAAFTCSPATGQLPLSVSFTDTSLNNPTSWLWNFGDGQTSTEQNPSHTYTTQGQYDVTLTVTNAFGSDTETKINCINAGIFAPTPDFTVDAQYGTPGTTFQFTDKTSANPAATYLWNFGDGQTSTEQNPAHEYASTGDYTVSLKATNSEGTATETKTAYIHIGNPPAVDFSGTPLIQLEPPMTVTFSDLSTGSPASWNWNFGDSQTSAEQNPAHTYEEGGAYDVSLTVTNAYGSITKAKPHYVVIGASPPVAGLSVSPQQAPVNSPVTCTDLSSQSPENAPDSWLWDFGDSQTSTVQNPTHKYTSPGDYTITLTVSNMAGTDSENAVIEIRLPPTAAFGCEPSETSEFPATITFTDQSSGATTWHWDFGDGQTSTAQNPAHIYQTDGKFTVTLTASSIYGSSKSEGYVFIGHHGYRPKAQTTISLLDDSGYTSFISAIGGSDVVGEDETGDPDWLALAMVPIAPYLATWGLLFWLIFYAMPFVVPWIRQESVAIPSVLGLIVGPLMLAKLPESYHAPAILFLALSIAGIIMTGITLSRRS